MELSKKENIIISWFVWHFYEMPVFLFSVWKNYLAFGDDFFSVTLLLKTLFSPWKRYLWKYPKGIRIGEFFSTLISNLFSRIIGVIGRSVLIILGILFQIVIFTVGALVIICWIFIPIIIIELMLLLWH